MDEQPTTYHQLWVALMELCPNGELCRDNDGQLVFYTGTQETFNGEVEPYEAE